MSSPVSCFLAPEGADASIFAAGPGSRRSLQGPGGQAHAPKAQQQNQREAKTRKGQRALPRTGVALPLGSTARKISPASSSIEPSMVRWAALNLRLQRQLASGPGAGLPHGLPLLRDPARHSRVSVSAAVPERSWSVLLAIVPRIPGFSRRRPLWRHSPARLRPLSARAARPIPASTVHRPEPDTKSEGEEEENGRHRAEQ